MPRTQCRLILISLPIPMVRNKLHPNSFFYRTVVFWNGLPRGCFPDYYDNLLKKGQQLSIENIFIIYTPYSHHLQQLYWVTVCVEWLGIFIGWTNYQQIYIAGDVRDVAFVVRGNEVGEQSSNPHSGSSLHTDALSKCITSDLKNVL